MVYITGDIHGQVEFVQVLIDLQNITQNDIIVLLGDVGLNYYGNKHGDRDRKRKLDAYWAMERVRKNEQNKLSSRFRKYFKRSRHLLMKPMEKLTDEEKYRLALMFEIAPRLADAYRVKNDFLTVIRSKSPVEGRRLLADWLLSVEVMDLPEFNDCTKAYHNWFNEIINSLNIPWTNGFIEGCNNKTKVLKRVCYGMRNFHNFRKRILFCNT